MSHRSRLYDLPELPSARSISSSTTASTARASVTSHRRLLDANAQEPAKRASASSSKLRSLSLSLSRPISTNRTPEYLLPLSRLSVSDDTISKTDSPKLSSGSCKAQRCPVKPPQENHASSIVSISKSIDDKNFEAGERNLHLAVLTQSKSLKSSDCYRCMVGLANLGNTCFMASQLQSLGCLYDIIVYFADGNHVLNVNTKSPSKGRLVQSFSALMATFRHGPDGHVIRPSDIKETLGSMCRKFCGYAQHDSQEFLRALLSGIHDDINEIRSIPSYSEITESMEDSDDVVSDRWWRNYVERNRSFISGLFSGQLKSHVICTKCSYKSRTFDPFWDLSLQIKSGTVVASSLNDCFRIFTAEELISDYYCSKCKAQVVATRRMSIHRFPDVLVIHLKRFEFSAICPRKLEAMVSFPLTGLDLTRYASETAKVNVAPIYDLKAVSNHYGNTSGGHYTAMGMISPAIWTEFNDSSANRVSASIVCSAAAYVLFFKLRHS